MPLFPDHTIQSVHGRQPLPAANARVLPAERQNPPSATAAMGIQTCVRYSFSLWSRSFFAPLLAIAAIAIRRDSPGPVIFQQRRNGFNGIPFVIFKFRTMTVLEDGPTVTQARPGDPRVTRVGKLLRRSSIDELPQLFNVLKGEMSLVGPRPHALAHDMEYQVLIDSYAFRYKVRPGITGWAQVKGLRGETRQLEQMAERIRLDLWYINHWSLRLDLYILLKTCLEVIRNRAY